MGGKGGFLFAAGPRPGAEKWIADWIDCKKSARIGQTNNSWRSRDPLSDLSSDAGAAQGRMQRPAPFSLSPPQSILYNEREKGGCRMNEGTASTKGGLSRQ